LSRSIHHCDWLRLHRSNRWRHPRIQHYFSTKRRGNRDLMELCLYHNDARSCVVRNYRIGRLFVRKLVSKIFKKPFNGNY
jgi:hypothetical protein